jgi:pSer/pThr/pTyr-binding forkhead associated (FHA) protein
MVGNVPGVSWRHAELLVFAGQWLIRDLGSTNGTFCAGHLVRRMKVADGVQFRLGDALLVAPGCVAEDPGQ